MKPSSRALLFTAWVGGSTQETLCDLAAVFRHKSAPRSEFIWAKLDTPAPSQQLHTDVHVTSSQTQFTYTYARARSCMRVD